MNQQQKCVVVGIFVGLAAYYVLYGVPSSRKKSKQDTSLRKRPKRTEAVCGLMNLGFTCFLNSLLQALACYPQMEQWLEQQIQNKKEKTVFAHNLLYVLRGIKFVCRNGPLWRIFLLVLNNKEPSVTEDCFAPHELIDALRRYGWSIGNEEQDAHEMLHVLWTSLGEELKNRNAVPSLLDVSLLTPKTEELENTKSLAQRKFFTVAVPDQENSNGKLCTGVVPNGTCTNAGDSQAKKDYDTDQNWDDNSDCESYKTCLSSVASSCYVPVKRNVSPPALQVHTEKRKSKERKPVMPGNGIVNRVPIHSGLHKSIWKSPFMGLLASQLVCCKCKYKFPVKYDAFDSITLHIPEFSWQRYSLPLLLKSFVQKETVTGVTCENCTKQVGGSNTKESEPVRVTCFKTLTIGKAPPCLCLHIHRLCVNQYGIPVKRSDHVEFQEYLCIKDYVQYWKLSENADPVEATVVKENNSLLAVCEDMVSSTSGELKQDNLLAVDLGSFKGADTRYVYRLKAVIVHVGLVQGGHFITYRRETEENGETVWFFTSDTIVRKVSFSEVLGTSAYMLFYEKMVHSA